MLYCLGTCSFILCLLQGVGLEKIDDLFSLSCPKFVAQNLRLAYEAIVVNWVDLIFIIFRCQDLKCSKPSETQLHFRNRIFSQGEISSEEGPSSLEEKKS